MSDATGKFQLPAGTCDSHFHIYGPPGRYPKVDEGRFTPVRAFEIEEAFDWWKDVGITRGVVVHAPGSGPDNEITYEALRRFPDRLRATAILSPDVTDRRLDELTDAGFKGVRVTMIRQDGKPIYSLGTTYDDLVQLAPRLAERGWHAQLWIESSDLVAASAELEKLPLDFVIDHMSRSMADKGHEHPDFVAFTEKLKTRRYWTKISGADRNTRIGRPYLDTAPYMRAIVNAAPEQVVWGSDWPHVGHTDANTPRMDDLLGLLFDCVPDEAVRTKILVDNPARLYGF